MTAWKNDHVLSRKYFPPTEAVKHAVYQFESITLEEMDSVKLMDRFDTKFVFSVDRLTEILQLATDYYRILEIKDHRIFNYQSLYYDTIGFDMYHKHHNRKLNRFKVRKREYVNTGLVFFEVKYKSNKGRTRKKRIEVSNRNRKFCKEEKKFLKKITPYRAKMLVPTLQNNFDRITLVHKHKAERVTIDIDLNYAKGSKMIDLPFLTIVEIKQGRNSGVSDLEKILKDKHILSLNFSKYCMGMVMAYNDLKYNRFKQKLIKINKLSNTRLLYLE